MENIKNYLSFLFNSDKLYGSYFTNESNDQYKNIFFEQKIKNDQGRINLHLLRGLFNHLRLRKPEPNIKKGLN